MSRDKEREEGGTLATVRDTTINGDVLAEKREEVRKSYGLAPQKQAPASSP